MRIGKVVGDVVSTIKHKHLVNRKIQIVELLSMSKAPTGKTILALDTVDAGAGDVVLLVDEGTSAAQILSTERGPVRTLIVGVIDSVNIEK
ncbi:MAG: EutN/CcmL family microcompartment protein [Candidatus Eisenbacteria bacterium]|nr:EutN/CcmL family microcompartment protein [Candidatus Eisenbacteria bacterium]